MRILRCTVLSTLALAAAMAADHPIIISGGSPLTIQHDGWKNIDDQDALSQFPDNTVTFIEVKPAQGDTQTFRFDHEQCQVSLSYGPTRVAIRTNPHGQALRMELDAATHFSKQFRHKDARTLESLRSDSTIGHLVIEKAGVAQSVKPFSGHVEIVIHYE